MKIAVYGAAGHTARFVMAELLRGGHTPIAIGRDATGLAAAAGLHAARIETRTARLDAPESLDGALAGAHAVIHCAGPFLDTAGPMIEAALRAGIHYVDITAEQGSALSTFDLDPLARARGVVVVPAAGFYGGLGDLLATHAMGDWPQADRIEIAIALDRWWPTRGTRQTGERNTAPRLVLRDGRLEPLQPSAPVLRNFPQPFGTQDVIELPLTETVLIARHLRAREIRNYINRAPLDDLRNPATPGPAATDERGRSNQRFVIEAIVRNGDDERRAAASGRDIYAVTAPIVVAAVARVCADPPHPAGAFALGQLVDATAFLAALQGRGEIDLTTDRMTKIAL